MPYVDANGVSAWYDQAGSGAPVIFLHGGFCSAEVMRELSLQLAGYEVYSPERPGHGRTADRSGAFHYQDGVRDTLGFMDVLGLESAHLVGFSDGANIGLLLALAHPERVRSLVHISGNLRPGDDVYRSEAEQKDFPSSDENARIEREYAALSPDGPEHARDVEKRILEMWNTEPQIDAAGLAALDLPVLVMAGDRDIISPDHTRLIQRSIPRAQLAIVPDSSHLLVRERLVLVGVLVREFVQGI